MQSRVRESAMEVSAMTPFESIAAADKESRMQVLNRMSETDRASAIDAAFDELEHEEAASPGVKPVAEVRESTHEEIQGLVETLRAIYEPKERVDALKKMPRADRRATLAGLDEDCRSSTVEACIHESAEAHAARPRVKTTPAPAGGTRLFGFSALPSSGEASQATALTRTKSRSGHSVSDIVLETEVSTTPSMIVPPNLIPI